MNAAPENASIRIDKWLWAARVFKTRNDATEACRAGKVEIDGVKAKPARIVKIGDTITARTHALRRTVTVKGVTDKRVGAKLVPDLLEDQTPESEVEAARERRQNNAWVGEPGRGRPNKKDRRARERFFTTGKES
jgi:ribosome-associated heat shock protein Hsp15